MKVQPQNINKVNKDERRSESKQDVETVLDLRELEIMKAVDEEEESTKGHNELKVNWNGICMRYVLSISIVGFCFGLQQDGKYDNTIIFFGFIHFAAELEPAIYLLFTPKIAKILAIIIYVIHISEAIAMLFTGYTMHYFFNIQFVFSDCMNFLAVVMFIFHPETNYKLYKMCVGFSLHYIGIFWALMITLKQRFYDSSQTIGLPWITMGVCGLLQLYAFKDIIMYNEYIRIPPLRKCKKCLLIACVILICGAFFVAETYRTKEYVSWEGLKWADSFFVIMLMRILGPLMAFTAVYGMCYYHKFANKRWRS